MQSLKARLVGVAPLCFHSERLANHTDPFTRELKKLTNQRKKTDETLEEIRWLEWRAGFYEQDGKVVVPADNVLATVLNGARKSKMGKEVEAGVIEGAAYFPLEYDGPKTIEGLRKDVRFCDYRSVVVGGRRVMRARPIFRDWALNVELLFDPEIIEHSHLAKALEIAGERVGMCERRPRWGRFTVEKVS